LKFPDVETKGFAKQRPWLGVRFLQSFSEAVSALPAWNILYLLLDSSEMLANM